MWDFGTLEDGGEDHQPPESGSLEGLERLLSGLWRSTTSYSFFSRVFQAFFRAVDIFEVRFCFALKTRRRNDGQPHLLKVSIRLCCERGSEVVDISRELKSGPRITVILWRNESPEHT